jgi:hypothetical protein
MPKSNSVFGHNHPGIADRTERRRSCDASQRGEFTVDQPRRWIGSFVEGLGDFLIRIQPERNDCLAMGSSRIAHAIALQCERLAGTVSKWRTILIQLGRTLRFGGRHFLFVARGHGHGLTIVLVSQVAPIFFEFLFLIGVDPVAMAVHRERPLIVNVLMVLLHCSPAALTNFGSFCVVSHAKNFDRTLRRVLPH